MLLHELREQVERLELVKAAPQGLQQKIIALFLCCADEFAFTAGDTLLSQDDSGTGQGLIVVDGVIQIHPQQRDPVQLHAPVLLGERQLFEQDIKRTADVVALTDGTALGFPWFRLAIWRDELLDDDEQEALAQTLLHYTWQWEQNQEG